MKLAVVRVRGDVRINHRIRNTFRVLGLAKKNHCTILEDKPHITGMLKAIEPYITWGQVDEKTLTELQKKGGKVLRLNPPRKGYGRKGVKMPFSKGGACGNRKEKINDLLMRMM
jgi:large subunit ribosomal protein L30